MELTVYGSVGLGFGGVLVFFLCMFFFFFSNVIYFKLLEFIVIKIGKVPYPQSLMLVSSFIREFRNTN